MYIKYNESLHIVWEGMAEKISLEEKSTVLEKGLASFIVKMKNLYLRAFF